MRYFHVYAYYFPITGIKPAFLSYWHKWRVLPNTTTMKAKLISPIPPLPYLLRPIDGAKLPPCGHLYDENAVIKYCNQHRIELTNKHELSLTARRQLWDWGK